MGGGNSRIGSRDVVRRTGLWSEERSLRTWDREWMPRRPDVMKKSKTSGNRLGLLDQRMPEEEVMDNLDFEEISDEELEEEAKANKGSLGDALGVDWASLVAECRPQKRGGGQGGGGGLDDSTSGGTAHRMWTSNSILARIGVSLEYAGEKLYKEVQQSLAEGGCELTSEVAVIHRAISGRQSRRAALFQPQLPKRALSARTDITVSLLFCLMIVSSGPTVGRAANLRCETPPDFAEKS
ncbi:hypothetical protein AAG570_001752 [Ranatra chinensis]|uniref:Uncharacterized protein n=1 Tax=Ranatra chinensis TaxID=642074 RepID=A0ABD0YNG6_9HEMI